MPSIVSRWLCLSRWLLRARQPHGWLVYEFYIALPTTLINLQRTCILFTIGIVVPSIHWKMVYEATSCRRKIHQARRPPTDGNIT
jgi:hypothetical protein